MLLGISEILAKYSDLRTRQEKVDWLKKHDSYALRSILKGAYDPNIEWDLPKDDPEYKPNPYLDQESMLYKESKRLYLFTKTGNPNLTQEKKLKLFVALLETVSKEDAVLLLHMRDRKLPYVGLTIKNINLAFENLIPVETAKDISTENEND